MPDLAWTTTLSASMPDLTRLPEFVFDVPMPDLAWTTKLSESMPDLTWRKNFIFSWASSTQSLRRELGSVAVFDLAARAVAQGLLADAVDDRTRAEDRWRAAANEWINKNARALTFWLISGVVVILFCQAAAVAPDLVDAVNRALATPLGLASLALAVYALMRETK